MDESFVVDLSVRAKDMIRGIGASFGIRNLFDEDHRAPLSIDYAPSTTIARPGRSVYMQLSTSTGW
jgi:outer membrane receptor protein involved in Fe transport